MPPLEGLKVVDLSRVLAGPFCAMLLGDMGADVIKIEEPKEGDDARMWGPFLGSWSAYFLGVNRNKRSLALDFKTTEGQATLWALLVRLTSLSRTSSLAVSTNLVSDTKPCTR